MAFIPLPKVIPEWVSFERSLCKYAIIRDFHWFSSSLNLVLSILLLFFFPAQTANENLFQESFLYE